MNIQSVEKLYKDATTTCGYLLTLQNNKTYSVPLDTANTDYQAIQEWIADGGVVIDNPPE
jgi:hypothetical protein